MWAPWTIPQPPDWTALISQASIRAMQRCATAPQRQELRKPGGVGRWPSLPHCLSDLPQAGCVIRVGWALSQATSSSPGTCTHRCLITRWGKPAHQTITGVTHWLILLSLRTRSWVSRANRRRCGVPVCTKCRSGWSSRVTVTVPWSTTTCPSVRLLSRTKTPRGPTGRDRRCRRLVGGRGGRSSRRARAA